MKIEPIIFYDTIIGGSGGEDDENEYFKELSLADLVSLYNNYFLSKEHGARFTILSERDFEKVEKRINKIIQLRFH